MKDPTTIAIKAVSVNGSTMPASSEIQIAPGDVVSCELQISDFAEVQGIRAYQATIETAGLISGDAGALIPKGWDAPFPTSSLCSTAADCAAGQDCREGEFGFQTLSCALIRCTSNGDCPLGLTCRGTGPENSYCAGLQHDPGSGAFIDETNPRYLHFGVAHLAVVAYDTTNTKLGSLTQIPGDAPSDTGQTKYVGTYLFRASNASDAEGEASGTFVLGFLNHINFSFIVEPMSSSDPMLFDTLLPLTVHVASQGPLIPATSGPLRYSLWFWPA